MFDRNVDYYYHAGSQTYTTHTKEALLKVGKAMLNIIGRLGIQTDSSSPSKNTIIHLLQDASDDVEFSVESSRTGLQLLPGARLPKPPLEIESWLADVADEIFRIGIEKHRACKCGDSESDHIFSAFLVFLMGYADAELKPGLDALVRALDARERQCVSDFERFRPSEN